MSRAATKSKSKGKAGGRGCRRSAKAEPMIPELALEQFEPACVTSPGMVNDAAGSIRYAWLGTGQCGGRLVKSFYDLGYRKALAVNTTHRDLRLLELPAQQKLLMDIGREGAGKDPARGREAASLYQQEILHEMEEVFGGDVDHIMVCFGAGGGTGTGSATRLVELAQGYARRIGLRNPHRSVGVMMTLPTAGEAASPKVAENAAQVAEELAGLAARQRISPLVVIDNDRITKMHPNLTVKQFWPTVNATTASLFDVFNRLSFLPSQYTSFDPTDYYSIVAAGGCCIMGLTEVRDLTNKFAISKAIRNNLKDTLLAEDFDPSQATVAGSIVVGGRKMMAEVAGLQDRIDYAFDILAEITGDATLHRGIYEDSRETLRVYTILGGLPAPARRIEQLKS